MTPTYDRQRGRWDEEVSYTLAVRVVASKDVTVAGLTATSVSQALARLEDELSAEYPGHNVRLVVGDCRPSEPVEVTTEG